MFYGLSSGAVDPEPYQFEHILEDIQTLNERARRAQYELTAISIHAYPYVADNIACVRPAAAWATTTDDRHQRLMLIADLPGKTIAIPGLLTTAYLAMQLLLGKGEVQSAEGANPAAAGKCPAGAGSSPAPEMTSGVGKCPAGAGSSAAFRARVTMFDEIPAAVASGQVDAGLIIHEGQLAPARACTWSSISASGGWKDRPAAALGGNVVRRDLGPKVCAEVTRIMKASIAYSLQHRPEAVRYALRFGRGLDESLADRFVGMYVNDWTLDYGPRGREAIRRLLNDGAAAGLVPACGEIDFVEG